MTADSDFEREVKRNYRHNVVVNVLDGTFFWLGASFIASRTILPLYVSHFTNSKLVIGLLSMIAAAGWLLPQLLTAQWVQRLPRKKVAPVHLGLFTERLPVLLMVPAAWLATYSPMLAMVAFFVLFTWHVIGAGVVAVAWQDMIAKIIPLDRRGRFFGVTNFGGTATGVLGAIAAAYILDRYDFPGGYTLCFAAAAVFIFISWVFLALTREPAQVSREPAISQREYWCRLPAILRGDLNFRRYLLSQIVITVGGMAVGFLAVYAVQRWHLPDSQAGSFTASMLIGQALSNLLFGVLADRQGHKLVLELSILLGALAVGLASLAPAPAWFYIVFALSGASAAGFMLSGIMIVFEFSAPDVRPTYIGLNNTVVGAVAAVAPMVGGWLAGAVGYRELFAVACGIGLMGFVLLHWSVREPRQAGAAVCSGTTCPDSNPPYMDFTLPVDERVDDLVARMTLEEKISQMLHDAPAIERLDVPKYNWWNECLHGVGRAGIATVFPQAIGLAATWNTELMHQVAVVISDEARAKHHEAVRRGIRERYLGLTFWSPNINIFRDPRWGRGQETYGEDPYLTARMGVAFVKGLQGDHPRYLKLVATPKHFAVHSGPEHDRHHFDARVDERDLRETYLPAFEACVREAKAASVMGAYNRTNGEPCCASPTLLEQILRQEWGFEGYVVSDCGAIRDIYKHHRVVETAAEAVALAVNAGCDLNCGETYSELLTAVEKGLISEATIDRAVKRLFTARFRLGMFDPPERVPYAQIPYEVNDSSEHRALALQTAQESIVLLKNEDDFLPLNRDIKSIAVLGPNADSVEVLLGNYHGTPSRAVTPLEGIRAKVPPGMEVLYTQGCDIIDESSEDYAEAVAMAEHAGVVIFVAGISQRIEGEEGQREGVPSGMWSKDDRTDLDLPRVQEELLKTIHATGTPVVVVLINGSALSVNWANAHVPAIVEAWYPGEEGGTAIADVLFGDYNPGGRLPVTFYQSVEDLPPFEDYRMGGRTYRYFQGEPLFPFGYGLSYTTFAYSNLRLSAETTTPDETLIISVDVQDVGERAGDEVVQLYVSDVAARSPEPFDSAQDKPVEGSVPVPIRRLRGFERIHLAPGETKTVTFMLTPRQLSLIDGEGQRVVEPGEFRVAVGGRQPSPEDFTDGGTEVLIETFEVIGKVTEVTF